jgi:hypothetical protein
MTIARVSAFSVALSEFEVDVRRRFDCFDGWATAT